MDDDQDKNTNSGESGSEISEEEKKSETEALAEVKEEELKSKIADDFGINAEDEPELFEKLLKKEQASREKLSKAIQQKISWRDKASKSKISAKPTDNPEEGEPQPNEGERPLTQKEFDKLFNEREAKRDLESLGLPEEIETEVKDLAKVKGISVREAAKLPYIVNAIEEAEKAKRISSATPKRKGRGSHVSVDVDPSKPLDPSDFALDTKEGRKAWKEAKAAKREHEAQQ